MYKKIKKIIAIILEALVLLFACGACYNDFLNGRIIWGIIMVVCIILWIIIDITKIISIIKYKKDSKKQKPETGIRYELWRCPCCLKTDLTITENKVICKSCGDWAWIEDACNSSWLKDITEEMNNE